MSLFETELGKVDWERMECGCGESAAHLPGRIRELASLDGEHGEAFTTSLHDHVMTPADGLLPVSAAFVPVAYAALAGALSEPARRELLGWILRIVGPAVDSDDDVASACVEAARQGLSLLYSEVAQGPSEAGAAYAFETLLLIEDDLDRLRAAQAAAGERLPWDLRSEEI
ncbi:hypothetical protein [Streptomyces acidiscabies]|uniref:hypothetical protein n=1 Tax=Streptomyces acidiscabies TaxID=42234 RepID=UPI00073ED46D|nr:hypothetical protein [Streptomyces acidiscabies]GAQ57777.1 hypothetical protein a10_07651 [Streptomyces acidiscabies]GAV42216.1 hypothetical protein Saa2_05138 [Streptomyces acidiscabies]